MHPTEPRFAGSAPHTRWRQGAALRSATAGVNKNGYIIPVGYAGDTTVESAISYPDPTGLAESLSQVVDIKSDTVTFRGFVVQMLNAP